jgi:hypothetical protein
LADLGVQAEPAVYHDDLWEEVRQQLLQVKGVLVWVNPLEGGGDRTRLDALLREVAARGIFVSTHPDIILKMGTKEVLYRTRIMGWGCDTHLYSSLAELRRTLPVLLARGEARVLKQYRGNGGDGVWKVELARDTAAVYEPHHLNLLPQLETPFKVRHAKRGSIEEELTLGEFFTRCEPYFANAGKMIDQAYQPRLAEGMIRCYLVHNQVVGFGLQAINALYPAPPGAPPTEAPDPGPRLYHPPTLPEAQLLKRKLEQEWVPAMQHLLDIETEQLPVLWDADFLLGPKTEAGEDTYVLCEINVSSVAPFPDSALPFLAAAALVRVQAACFDKTYVLRGGRHALGPNRKVHRPAQIWRRWCQFRERPPARPVAPGRSNDAESRLGRQSTSAPSGQSGPQRV